MNLRRGVRSKNQFSTFANGLTLQQSTTSHKTKKTAAATTSHGVMAANTLCTSCTIIQLSPLGKHQHYITSRFSAQSKFYFPGLVVYLSRSSPGCAADLFENPLRRPDCEPLRDGEEVPLPDARELSVDGKLMASDGEAASPVVQSGCRPVQKPCRSRRRINPFPQRG